MGNHSWTFSMILKIIFTVNKWTWLLLNILQLFCQYCVCIVHTTSSYWSQKLHLYALRAWKLHNSGALIKSDFISRQWAYGESWHQKINIRWTVPLGFRLWWLCFVCQVIRAVFQRYPGPTKRYNYNWTGNKHYFIIFENLS